MPQKQAPPYPLTGGSTGQPPATYRISPTDAGISKHVYKPLSPQCYGCFSNVTGWFGCTTPPRIPLTPPRHRRVSLLDTQHTTPRKPPHKTRMAWAGRPHPPPLAGGVRGGAGGRDAGAYTGRMTPPRTTLVSPSPRVIAGIPYAYQ